MEDRELRRAMAKASLLESWQHAKSAGLDRLNDDEIDQESIALSHLEGALAR